MNDVDLPGGAPQLEDLPLQNDEGFVRHPQNPELAVVDGRDERAFVLLGANLRLHGPMSSRLNIWSSFLDGLVTRRDRERRPTLDHHTLAVDHHGAGHCAAGPAVGHVHLDGGCVSAARRQAAGEVGIVLGDVRALLVEAVRVAGELKNRSLPSLAAATKESLSFYARISGFMGQCAVA